MNNPRRKTCRNCGILIRGSKDLCTKCEIQGNPKAGSMAERLDSFEQTAADHLADMEKRRQELSGSLDTSLQDRLSSGRATPASTPLAEPSRPVAEDETEVALQSPTMFAKLERLCSEIRHSIVEACFYNLKLQAQMLPKKAESADFMAEFRRNLQKLPDVADRLRDFFNAQIDARLKISSLFRDEHRKAMEGLRQLRHTSAEDARLPGQAAEISKTLLGSIDTIVSSLQSIDDRVRKNKVDVKDLLAGVAAASKERCEEAGVELTIQLPEEPLPKIYSAESLSDVIFELIRNALKHAFPLAGMAEKCIEIAAHLGDEPHRPIVIHVRDNGQGLPGEALERVRAGESPAEGNGFGLPMVIRHIEELHNGKVDCESVPGQGTRFILSIPTRVNKGT